MYADILTISLEKNPAWEASQEIICVVYTPKVYYHVHKSLPRGPVVRQINPVHTPSYLLKIHFNIILYLRLANGKDFFTSSFNIWY